MFLSCSESTTKSPSETAKAVAESFFSKDVSALKKHTTTEGYASLITVQNMIPDSDKNIEVEILDEAVDGEIAWIKNSTTYDGKTGISSWLKKTVNGKLPVKDRGKKGLFNYFVIIYTYL
ncbi:hypothetical protein OQ279_08945 [Salinimicrobium sp. MT39]|uniref:Uncharacterized protein n=1 Tax=Salinimicrobium profundisediminis TaxID=2994553 RepID=A0A9X3I168_9FLAO|nr:hypothetical protein [Salinimicrobium profundisediminis]MCX2838279.1 hypothetical protein [Salinimicrobium profundisediminis]